MKLRFAALLLLLSSLELLAQDYNLQTNLDPTVSETSGLLYLNNTLITHNDSGNTAQLFDIDTTTGTITRTISITNANNIDWEDIAADDTYIYIGDFGNNQGTRTDLKIYRVLITDYLNNNAITADVINFSYSDQSDFSPNPFDTNFDAEALIHFNNQLYIFTKNWVNNETHIYELPKTPGTYSISRIDSFNSQGLITGATFNTAENTIALCGYNETGSFLIELKNFSNGLFSNGITTTTNITIPMGYSFQTEGITAFSTTNYYVSAEAFSSDLQGLYNFNIATLETDEEDLDTYTFYPNPAKTHITITCNNCSTKIFSSSGQLVKTSNKIKVDISDLATGVYEVKIIQNKKYTVKKLIIN